MKSFVGKVLLITFILLLINLLVNALFVGGQAAFLVSVAVNLFILGYIRTCTNFWDR